MRWTVLAAAGLLAVGCASTGTADGGSTAPKVTPSAAPAATPAPTPTPRKSVTIGGQGTAVTDKFNLEKGSYRVTWKAEGNGNFIVHAHSGERDVGLINEILPDVTAGQAFLDVCPQCNADQVGVYYLEVKGRPAAWSLTFDPV